MAGQYSSCVQWQVTSYFYSLLGNEKIIVFFLLLLLLFFFFIKIMVSCQGTQDLTGLQQLAPCNNIFL